MKTSRKIFFLYAALSLVFIVGSFFDIDPLTKIANYLLIPTLILYYRYKTKKWFIPMVVALLFFYIRDIFLHESFNQYPGVILYSFAIATFILYVFAVTGFQRTKVHLVEIVSLLIMYGFLGFLLYTISELVPQVVPSYRIQTYLYLFLLTLLLAITFTEYLLKSHYASLWLMLASASLLVSELSLFFQMYVISDVSVKLLYPFFHVTAYYALIQHALHRRRSKRFPLF